MEKHLAFGSIIRKGAAGARRFSCSRRGAATISVALALVTLYSTSSAAASAVGRLLRDSPTVQALAATPGLSRTPFAGLLRAAAQAQSNTLNVGRRGHTATRLPDGKVLIVGGENAGGPLSLAEIFDPASRTFTPGADAGAARTEHAAVRLNDGRVLITGGRDAAGNLASTQLFDQSSGLFAEGPSLALARAGHSATVLADGRVLIVGGDEEGSAEIFDPQAQSFTALDETLYAARSGHSAVLLKNGKVLIVGGNAPLGNPVQSGEIFDPAEESFSPLVGAMNMPRTRPVLRELPGGLVQVIGGSSDSSMEIYVPANDAFQAYAHLPATTPVADVLNSRTRVALFRNGQAGALLDRDSYTLTEIPQSNLALVTGGADSGGQVLNTVSVLNSSAATVTTDKIDYGPGELVTMTGTGFQPNEVVTLTMHEEQAAHADRTFTSVADGAGNFTNTDFTPEAHHFGVTFVLTAKGQSSSFVAQTTFTDAATIPTRVTVGSVFRTYGQTALSIPVTFCRPTTDGTGVCTGIDGEEIEFYVGGVLVGKVTTSTQVVNGVQTPGRAVLSYNELKNAGGSTIIAKFLGDENYMANQGTAGMTIGKVTPTLTWQNPLAPISYGTPLSSTQLSATSRDNTVNSQFTGQPVPGAFNYSRPAGTVMDASNTSTTSQSLSVTFVPTETVNYANRTAFSSIIVTKVPLVVTPNSYARSYGQANPELTGVINGIQNNDPITATFSTVATQTSGAGTYDITATLSDPSLKLKNYTAPTLNKGTLTVNKVTLDVTADNKSRTFGTDNPPFTFTYTGFVLDETASTPGVLSGAPSLTTSATANSPAGAYPITISLGTLAAPNYDFNLVPATLTVSKAQSVLNLSGLTQTFDGSPKAVTVTTDPPGLEGVSVSYNGSAQAPANAGSYAVTATLNNPNFESATATGTLVVNKASQVINFAPIANHRQGDAPFALDATSSAGLPVSFEVVSGSATLAGNLLTINGAGPVAVRASQPGDANHEAAASVVRTFDVSKASATIHIDPNSLAHVYTGGGKAATVTTTPAGLDGLSVSYSQGGVNVPAPTNAGTYGVTATLNNPNYEAASATATLVIGQAEVQVTLQNSTHTFDGLPHPATATVTGSGGQDFGTLSYTYSARGNFGPDAFEPALPAPPPGEPAQVPPAPAYSVLNDPPAAPHLIVVFPERDFVSIENYSQADGLLTINVLRRDQLGNLITVGSATATPQDDPTTPNFDGLAEVNHPGGSCWVGSTPNIRPGDIVRVTNAAGVADQTTVAYVSAGRPVQVDATTIRISGKAMDAAGNPLPLDFIEQRLISSSNDPFVLSGRRDLRAPGNGTLVYDDEEDPTHWTATYTGLTQADIDRAMRVESRILWLGRNPAAENELTIFEIGDGVFGGPQAPCSAPLEGTTPTQAFPPPPAPAYSVLNDPPAAPHLIVVFPERDFVSIENYARTDGPVTINVLRPVTEPGGATSLRTVGSSVVELTDDPTTPNFDGIAEVNHPGGGCWIGTTPDIRPGDIVRVTNAAGVADQTTVSNVKAEKVVQVSANTVVVRGTAQDAAGNPLPIDQIEQRMISSSADRFNVNGRRDIRAVAGGGEVGTLAYDAPGSIHWTATYTNLGSQDVERALRSETRILWLGRNQAAENELTIFEIGDGVFGGPQAPCSAPLEGSAEPVWVGTYDVSVSLSGNPNFRIAANTAQISIVKAAPLVSVTGGSFPYDGQPHPATVVVTGVGGGQFVPPDANTTVTYGPAATTDPPVAAGTHSVTAAFAGSRNYNTATATGSVVISNGPPVVADKQVATDEDRSVEIFLSATDPEGNGTAFTVVGNPAHGRLGPMGEVICAANEAGTNDFCGVSVTYTPDANYNGPDSLTFKASDGANDSNVATVSITVNAVNDAPQVEAGPGGNVLEGGTFTSTGSFTDPDGGDNWTATVNYGDGTGAQQIVLNPDKTFSLSRLFKDSGTYTVTVTVTDGAGASASDTATVTSGNVAPTAGIVAPATGPEGTVIDLRSTATDPSEADTAAGFRYLWIIKKNGNPLAQSSLGVGTLGMTNFPFTPDDNGSYEVTLKVTDKDNGTATVVKTITVTNVTPKPTITGVPYSSPEATQITLGSTVKDVSGPDTAAGFKYLWVVKKNGAPYAQSALGDGTLGMSSYSFTPDEEGTYTVTLKVTDKDGGATSVSRTIMATNVEPSDDFNDNVMDAGRWSSSNTAGMTVAEQGAQLRVTTPAGSAVGYDGYYARTNFNLTNARATVELVQAAVGYGTETYFTLVDKATGGSTDMVFAVGGANSLLMRERFNGTITSQASITYDPAQHRFLRYRHDQAADTVNWETSPDGMQWTVRHTTARRVNLTKMQGQLSAGRYNTTTPSTAAVFDNYRIEPVPPSPVLLSDDFNDNSADASKWTTVTAEGMTVLEQNQRLEVTTPGTGYGGFYSASNYNLAGAQATVETVQAARGYGTDTYFVLHDKTTERNSFFMTVGGNPGTLLLQETYNSVAGARATIPYDAVQHRFWRIRHDAFNGTVNWETSPDRLQWTVRLTTPQRFDISNMQARIYAGRYSTTTPASLAVFDNFVFERLKAVLTPSDNFNDNTLDTMRWMVLNSAAYITVREQNQRVELALPANTASFNGVWSQPQTNFWSKTLSVEIPQATNTGGAGMETYFSIQRNGSNYFQVLITGTNTIALDAVANGVVDRTQLSYDPAAHRFWRFRHHSATNKLFFESSADGVTWATLKTADIYFPLDNMRVFMSAGSADASNSTPGSVVFDNLRLESNE